MKMIGISKNKILAFLVCSTLLICCIPCYAHAADKFPGVDEETFTGNTAKTNMNLKVDDSQLNFTAPSVINFAMYDNGIFVTPSDDVAYIKNNSLMPIKVVKYDVTSDTEANGVVDVSSTSAKSLKNAYQINVKVNSDGAIHPFAISSNAEGGTPLSTDWIMQKSGTTGNKDKLGLRFSDGKMINISDGTWTTDNGHALQTVIWTVSANLN